MGRTKKTETEDQVNEEIGARLALIRAEKRWSQTELASRLEISPAHLNGLESGKYSFTAALILKLSRLLGQPASALLGADPPEDKQTREWTSLFSTLPRRDRAVLVDLARKLESWSQAFTVAIERLPSRGPARLISLEGIDGVLLREIGGRLQRHMSRESPAFHCWYDHDNHLWQYMIQTFERTGDSAKRHVLERTLLFACERLYRQETEVRLHLGQGHTVITPFYAMAAGVYQEMEGVGDTRFIDIIDSLLLQPDVIIVVRSSPKIAARRAVRRRPKEGQFYSPYGLREFERARDLYDKAREEFMARGYQVRSVDVDGDATDDLIEQLAAMVSPPVSFGAA